MHHKCRCVARFEPPATTSAMPRIFVAAARFWKIHSTVSLGTRPVTVDVLLVACCRAKVCHPASSAGLMRPRKTSSISGWGCHTCRDDSSPRCGPLNYNYATGVVGGRFDMKYKRKELIDRSYKIRNRSIVCALTVWILTYEQGWVRGRLIQGCIYTFASSF